MRNGFVILSFLFLFFQIVSEEYSPEMTPEVVSDIEIMFEEASFQSYQSGMQFNNHVSTVKLQIGGNCTRWSTNAALETALSIMLDGNRPPSSIRTDWTPVYLSNSWTVVMTEQDPDIH